jgi:small subunit ribosomal protein S17e
LFFKFFCVRFSKTFINQLALSIFEGIAMGRIKPRRLKSITEKTFEENSDAYTDSFDDNKKIVSERLDVKSKKLRNKIAGYAARLKKRESRK